MKKLLRALKKIWILNLLRRVIIAAKYYNPKYKEIIKWGFRSNEDTNFTYELSEGNIKYLAHTISTVNEIPYTKVMEYFKELNEDQALKDTITKAINTSPHKNIADKTILYGRRMGWYAFVRTIKPKCVIETGVDKGLGAVVLCAALLRNKEEGHEGRYYGTDINPEAGYFLQEDYKSVGEILYGDSIESLSKITTKIDLFINDSDHSADYEYREYQTITDLLSDNAIILGDNAHVSSSLADYSLERNRKFLFFQEEPNNHWYPGAGIGISFK